MSSLNWPPRRTSRKLSIVAEIGPNHHGRLELALELIRAAAAAGADAVKFQIYKPNDMVPMQCRAAEAYRIPPDDASPWAGEYLYDVYSRAPTPVGWFPELAAHAAQRGMVAFASVFSPATMRTLLEMGCPAIKIASPEVADPFLMEAVKQAGRVPVVLSDGATHRGYLNALAFTLAERHHVTILRCASQYPANASDYGLRMVIPSGYSWGVSDHTRGSAVACAAIALGATMLEKHLMLEPAAYDGEQPLDAGHSLTPGEFGAYVNAAQQAYDACHGQRPEVPDLAWRRVLVWRFGLPRGEPFADNLVRTARANRGIEASKVDSLNGRVLGREVVAGVPVYEHDFDGP